MVESCQPLVENRGGLRCLVQTIGSQRHNT